jgi:25S rRNA (uracil2634-N3)-methyltransferase
MGSQIGKGHGKPKKGSKKRSLSEYDKKLWNAACGSGKNKASKGNGLVVVYHPKSLQASRVPNKECLRLYGINYQILILGDGDFSFALALATQLDSDRICATSFDDLRTVLDKYNTASSNIATLTSLGVKVYHKIDATDLREFYNDPADPKYRFFNKIIFNFPHVGGATEEDIAINQKLLSDFFSSARALLLHSFNTSKSDLIHHDQDQMQNSSSNDNSSLKKADYEVHVALRTTAFYLKWDLEKVALQAGMKIKKIEPLNLDLYPCYTPQRTNPAVREAPSIDSGKLYIFTISNIPTKSNQTLDNNSEVEVDSKSKNVGNTKASKMQSDQTNVSASEADLLFSLKPVEEGEEVSETQSKKTKKTHARNPSLGQESSTSKSDVIESQVEQLSKKPKNKYKQMNSSESNSKPVIDAASLMGEQPSSISAAKKIREQLILKRRIQLQLKSNVNASIDVSNDSIQPSKTLISSVSSEKNETKNRLSGNLENLVSQSSPANHSKKRKFIANHHVDS